MQPNKPSWQDAPEWANYLAQDAEGSWYWYDECPRPRDYEGGESMWDNNGSEFKRASWSAVKGDWRDTLEQRPSNTPLVSMGDMIDALADMIEYAECNDPGCPHLPKARATLQKAIEQENRDV